MNLNLPLLPMASTLTFRSNISPISEATPGVVNEQPFAVAFSPLSFLSIASFSRYARPHPIDPRIYPISVDV